MAVTLKDILPVLDTNRIIKITEENVTTIHHSSSDDMILDSYEKESLIKKINIFNDDNLGIIYDIILEDKNVESISSPNKLKTLIYRICKSDWENSQEDNLIYKTTLNFDEVTDTSKTTCVPGNTEVFMVEIYDGKFEVYSNCDKDIDAVIEMWQFDFDIVFKIDFYDPEIWSPLRNS